MYKGCQEPVGSGQTLTHHDLRALLTIITCLRWWLPDLDPILPWLLAIAANHLPVSLYLVIKSTQPAHNRLPPPHDHPGII